MKYRAVVFDMFGTLVNNFSQEAYYRVLTDMAKVLDAPPDDFRDMWQGLWEERMTGKLRSPEGLIDHICQALDVRPDESQCRQAAKIMYDMTRRELTPWPDTVDVLTRLKADGYGTGLVSDCTSELPGIWDELSLAKLIDVPILSCVVGVMKPDPRIYRLVAEGLGVKPSDCVYVGDGIGRELPGAAEVGMHPVMIRTPGYVAHPLSMDVADWSGPLVSSLTEVLALLD